MDMPLLTEAALMSETSLTSEASFASETSSTPETPIKPDEPLTPDESYMSEESLASLAFLAPLEIIITPPDMIEFYFNCLRRSNLVGAIINRPLASSISCGRLVIAPTITIFIRRDEYEFYRI